MVKSAISAVLGLVLITQGTQLSAVATSPGPPPTTERVSVDSAGNEVGGTEYWSDISADGRFIVFQGATSSLVPNDTNGFDDIFVHDRLTGITDRVNVATSGEQANFISYQPDISADGRFVSFWSFANNLVPSDTNGVGDVFLRDRQLGLTERVDLSSDEAEANGGAKTESSVSTDGRFVAFQSDSYNLVPGDPFGANGSAGIYLRDRQSGTVELISFGGDGTEVTAEGPSVSGDGRFVAFHSVVDHLVPGDTGYDSDVFIRDRVAGVTEIVSVGNDGGHGNSHSYSPGLSGDGRFVAFASQASNLVTGDTNGSGVGADIFVRDRQSGTTWRVSVDSAGNQTFGAYGRPDITSDGRFVLFESGANDLVAGDTNNAPDVFIHDNITRTTARVSIGWDGGQAVSPGAYSAWRPSVSSTGRFVTFISNASNLVPDDTNQSDDVFVRDLGDTDGDGEWNAFDSNDDNDILDDATESACGSNPVDPSSLPERIDTLGDDDGDTLVNEGLPAGAEAYDCDGDGFKGSAETSIFVGGGNGDQDLCGTNGWPSDLVPGGIQPNTFNIADLGSFVVPVRRIGTSVGDPGFDPRWDLVPGSAIGAHIAVTDIAATVVGVSGFPPMFGGLRAYGKTCPWAP